MNGIILPEHFDESVVVHRFPTISKLEDWFEIEMDMGLSPLYVQRRFAIWARTLRDDMNVAPRVLRYIEMAKDRQRAEGDGIKDLPVEPARRLIVHKPPPF